MLEKRSYNEVGDFLVTPRVSSHFGQTEENTENKILLEIWHKLHFTIFRSFAIVLIFEVGKE